MSLDCIWVLTIPWFHFYTEEGTDFKFVEESVRSGWCETTLYTPIGTGVNRFSTWSRSNVRDTAEAVLPYKRCLSRVFAFYRPYKRKLRIKERELDFVERCRVDAQRRYLRGARPFVSRKGRDGPNVKRELTRAIPREIAAEIKKETIGAEKVINIIHIFSPWKRKSML